MKITYLDDEYNLFAALKQYKNIIVYGAGNRCSIFIERLQMLVPNLWVNIAVSDIANNPNNIRRIAVRRIEDISASGTDVPVVIAIQPKYHEEIFEKLKSLGFSIVFPISENIWTNILSNYRYDDLFRQIHKLNEMLREHELMTYQKNHAEKLSVLREKVKAGSRIRVVFLVTSLSKFGFASVYRAMEKNPLFEPMIYLFDEYINEFFDAEKSTVQQDQEKLKAAGYTVYWDFDSSTVLENIEALQADIVFYNAQYLPINIFKVLSFRYLTCYIPYAYYVVKHDEYHFNNPATLMAWKVFLDSKPSMKSYVNHSMPGAINGVLAGYPKLDSFCPEIMSLPEKIRCFKKIVIYAPHHSIMVDKDNIFSSMAASTFHLYNEKIAALLNKHPDIGFVFKPHPTLRNRLKVLELCEIPCIRAEEYDSYCVVWDNMPNGIVVTDDSYMSLFAHADCLITDCGSFICEWLITQKPCLYLLNPDNPNILNEYYDFGRDILASYYLCNCWSEIEEQFRRVVLNGEDTKTDERKRQANRFFHNVGHAGKFIAEYIAKQLEF